jgi:integral membrane protein (TIGR00529 family)
MLPYLGIVISFLVVFLLALFKVNLALSLITGAVVLGILFMTPSLLYTTFIQTISSFQTVELVLNLVSISILNKIYASSRGSEDLVNSLRKMVSSSLLMILMPILFGILPVSGGALFSAPLVDLEGQKLALKTEQKIFFNMWFRHIPHLIYPLETALVIAATLSHISLGDLLLYQLPVFSLGLLIGFPLALHRINEPKNIHIQRAHVKEFLQAFWPILTVVFLIAIFQTKVYLATTFGSILILLTQRITISFSSRRAKDLISIAGLAIALMLYRNYFEVSGAVTIISALLQNQVIWQPLLLVGVAFLIGFVIGESTPSTTLTMAVLSHFAFNPATAGLVFTSVYLGHLVSPLHLCFAVTADYFKAHLVEMYHRLLPATIVTLIGNVGIMLVLDILIT